MLNVSGHSLVEMTIGIAVMGAMIVALASVNDFIGKENNSIRETMAVLQVERDVINAITKRDVTNTKLPFCDMLFTNAGNLVNPASLPFDATLVTPVNPYKFAIKAIPGIGGIADVAAAAGARVNTLSESLFLRKGTDNPPGIQVVVTSLNPATATINLNFDQTRLVRAVRNLSFVIKIATSPPGPATQITGCKK